MSVLRYSAGDEFATGDGPCVLRPAVWPLPGYLGLQGCLERLRFAVDPVRERFYFGPTG